MKVLKWKLMGIKSNKKLTISEMMKKYLKLGKNR